MTEPTSGDGAKGWTRADRLNAIGVAVALTVAVVPLCVKLVNKLNRAEAGFSLPLPGKVATRAFPAHGSASNIPASSDLWIVLRSGVEGRWYPVERLNVTHGQWHVDAGTICPTAGLQELWLVLVSDTDSGQLLDYVRKYNTPPAAPHPPGVSSLPPNHLLKIQHITVPDQPSCS